jgi:surface antigen
LNIQCRQLIRKVLIVILVTLLWNSILSSTVDAVPNCGTRSECSYGENNHNPYCCSPSCCDNNCNGINDSCDGNCVWWAWDRALCEAGIALPFVAGASKWRSIAENMGYQVSNTPAVNTIAWHKRGHVAWVIAVNETTVTVSEMNCWNTNGKTCKKGCSGDPEAPKFKTCTSCSASGPNESVRLCTCLATTFQYIYPIKFRIGDSVRTTGLLKVRTGPGLKYSEILPIRNANTTGTILEGPIAADNYTWWKIRYDDGVEGWSSDHRLKKAPKPNTPPIASAGPDKEVFEGQSVILEGSGSDPDGDSITFRWSCKGGTLSNSSIAQPTYTAPMVSRDTTYTCTLTVTDNKGASAKDDMVVRVKDRPNRPPVADAGPDQTVQVGSTVQLDGSSSSDPDGDPLTFYWRFTSRPRGSIARLSNYRIVNPTFIADKAGDYLLELRVNDGRRGRATDQVKITAKTHITPLIDDFSSDSGLWTYVGSAFNVDTGEEYTASAYRDLANEYLVLTENKNYQAGVIWLNRDIFSPFTAEFRYKAGGGTGADGIVFMFYKKKDYKPYDGGALGFTAPPGGPNSPTAVPGYGIELDNWYNDDFNDPSANHIALIKDHVNNHLRYINDERTEDYAWHSVKIIVGKSIIEVYIDDELAFAWEGPIDRTYGGLGFSGTTGSRNNWHIIDDVKIIMTQSTPQFGPSDIVVEKIVASSTPAHGPTVKFGIEGIGIAEARVQIFNSAAYLVYDSGFIPGNSLEWKLVTSNGQLIANGVYLYVITVRGYDGRVIKSEVRKLVVLR